MISNHKRRMRKDFVLKGVVVACVAAVLLPLLDMLYLFIYNGLQVLTIQRLTTTTLATSNTFAGGGLANAIAGTGVLIALAAAVAVPLGIFGGVYMAEFSNNSRFSEALRFAADVLAGVPSIVLGYVGFLVFVLYFGWGYSALAAGITLAILMFPYIFRTTDLAMRRVPQNIREGAIALGSTKTTMINRLTIRFAIPGILTGVLISLGIGLSETAPLLYTASFSNYMPSTLIHNPVAYLTYVVWVFSQLPSTEAHDLAYLACFILLSIVLLLNIVARLGLARFTRTLRT